MPPAGFEPHDRRSPLTAPWEPIYCNADGAWVVLGVEIRAAHTNSRGLVHGGLVDAGYTLLGSPTVIAHFTLPEANSQVAARLLDVAPDGKETLVARGLWRPSAASHPARQVFQLHANG